MMAQNICASTYPKRHCRYGFVDSKLASDQPASLRSTFPDNDCHNTAELILSMTKDDFLLELDNILQLPAGTLRGHEKLEELYNWDSTALITMIVLAESNTGARIAPSQVVNCSTVGDLLRLARVENGSSS
jgi:acyl carrier protein